MKLTWAAFAATFATVSSVNAHFQVTFPAARGAINEDDESQFCGQQSPSAQALTGYVARTKA